MVAMVTFFETTEGTEGESHQTRSMCIFLGVFCGYYIIKDMLMQLIR